ncbi:MAG TPA: hypothetical protein EYN06_03915 [Myxococcales bacterium]|nr:hypothetical protein [Myxococcales bacterium]
MVLAGSFGCASTGGSEDKSDTNQPPADLESSDSIDELMEVDADPPQCGEPLCSNLGEQLCGGVVGYSTCGLDKNGCQDWGPVVFCQPDNQCAAGMCMGECIKPKILFVLPRGPKLAGAQWLFAQAAINEVVAEAENGVYFGVRVASPDEGECSAQSVFVPALKNKEIIANAMAQSQKGHSVALAASLRDAGKAFGPHEQGQHLVVVLAGTELCESVDAVIHEIHRLRWQGVRVHVLSVGFSADEQILEAVTTAADTAGSNASNDVAMVHALRNLIGSMGSCCIDNDQDGHGPYCDAGPDCNDQDETTHTPSCAGKICGDNGCGLSCGECKAPAHAASDCVEGQCVESCLDGYHECGGECVEDNNVDHCGESCAPCLAPSFAVAACVDGDCAFVCDSGYHSCGELCVANEQTQHCGALCEPCPELENGTSNCIDGQCGFECDAGHKNCEDACVPCPDGAGVLQSGCKGGQCVVVECAVGYVVCEGLCCDFETEKLADAQGVASTEGAWPQIRLDFKGVPTVVHHAVKAFNKIITRSIYFEQDGVLEAGWKHLEIDKGNFAYFGAYPRLAAYAGGTWPFAYHAGANGADPELKFLYPGKNPVIMSDKIGPWPYNGTDYALAAAPGGLYARMVYPSGQRLSTVVLTGIETPQQSSVDEEIDYKFTHSPALAVQEDGVAHVVYFRQKGSKTELMHAVGAASSWAKSVIDEGFSGFGKTRFELKLVNQTAPVFCYFNQKSSGKQGLSLGRWVDGVWELEQVDPDGQQACSLDLDLSGHPVLLYRSNSGGLRVARESAGGWQIKELVSPSDTLGIRWPTVALDAAGTLHAAYWDADQQAVYYLKDTAPFASLP